MNLARTTRVLSSSSLLNVLLFSFSFDFFVYVAICGDPTGTRTHDLRLERATT